ncbi:hypothetical protein CARUB_v10003618mg [Capsella rubella]|uniref:RING-type E3 ubiquitin transferase n=1 Tax=Capsella rubella TaxID=81985 RepID=R0FLM8_9BRAS|nr:LON peptidase N-terminal domain and RING finger protein 3 [Capsella rubella]EOA22886.1 hypothetical protein CARUB_v10003618mg [Capsella rubella]
MNDPIPEPVVEIHVQARRLSPSEGDTSSVLLIITATKDEIYVNPTTGHHLLLKSEPDRYGSTNFSLHSCNHHEIQTLLQDRIHRTEHWMCDHLVPRISTAAINSGFGCNGVELTVCIVLTYQRYVDVMPDPSPSNTKPSLRNMVLLGRVDAEELKSLNMETELCSICLESLVSTLSTPTRMSCSHVFHGRCLLNWLDGKNTCPLCRTVLYER